jgi:hypothetical protein
MTATSFLSANPRNIKLLCIGVMILAMGLSNEILGQNLIPNPGFEQDSVSPFDMPDFYHPRLPAYQQKLICQCHRVQMRNSTLQAASVRTVLPGLCRRANRRRI